MENMSKEEAEEETIYVLMIDDWGSVFSKPTTPYGAWLSRKEAESVAREWSEYSYEIHEMVLHR